MAEEQMGNDKENSEMRTADGTDKGITAMPDSGAGDDGETGAVCCCGDKTTERSPEEVKRLINRLNRIEGQIRGIRGMVERDAYCPDILTQSAAVTAAMNAFNRELMSNHIKHCVVRDIKEGKEDTVDELVFTLQKLMK